VRVLAATAIAILCLMVSVWIASVVKRDASIVDSFWGLGFGLVAWVAFALGPRTTPVLVTTVLVTLWGVRLSTYITVRNHGKGEDFRYRDMRARVGPRFVWVSFFTVFLLQGALLWVVALPVQTLAWTTDASFGPVQGLGALVFAVGLTFEAVGDAQLARWKKDPACRGKVMDRGLWRYSRHPNYFGDFCVWWGIYLLAIGTGAPVWSGVGPAVMSLLLLRVSGVTLLEQSLRARPGYEDYVARTSAFFPWPPRRPPPT
jgi:steroid 5-alpha reductase family enzyme